MRSDSNLPKEFRDEGQWSLDPETGSARPDYERLNSSGTEFHRHSYSGSERNRLFLNLHGERFVDISAVSGVDEVADSRSWVKWDFDRDGWLDIALVNANRPLLSLFRNQLGSRERECPNNSIAVRFVGANHVGLGSNTASNRDGYGAVVLIETDQLKMRREHRCGDGYAAQNSSTMMVGIGKASTVRLTVTWPSGETSGPVVANAGQLVKCFEKRTQAPNGSAFEVREYR